MSGVRNLRSPLTASLVSWPNAENETQTAGARFEILVTLKPLIYKSHNVDSAHAQFAKLSQGESWPVQPKPTLPTIAKHLRKEQIRRLIIRPLLPVKSDFCHIAVPRPSRAKNAPKPKYDV